VYIKRRGLFFIISFHFAASFAQSPLATDTSVKVFPHWKKGETHSLVIRSSTEELTEGKTDKSLTVFYVDFNIIEKDTSGYTVEWIYTRADLPPNEINLENIILASLLNQKIIFKLSLTGRFKELINYDQVKAAFDINIGQLIRGSSNDQVKNIGFQGAKQMTTNRKSLEIVLLKQVKFYNLSFGFKYRTHFTQTNTLSFPNAMGGNPFDGTEKILLTKLDTSTGICVIERTSSIEDKTGLKNQIFRYMLRVAKQDSATVQKKFGNNNFEFSEISMQEINYLKGIPQKSYSKRIVNFGFEDRIAVLEVETIK
jgi:hypothetical protein